MGCKCGQKAERFKKMIGQPVTRIVSTSGQATYQLVPQPMSRAERMRLRGLRIAARNARIIARNAEAERKRQQSKSIIQTPMHNN